MISFKETTNEVNDDFLKESRLLRKGVALLLARSSKKHGDTAENHFNSAKRSFTKKPNQSIEDQVTSIASGLNEMCDGLISLRKQSGSITGIATTAVLLNEKTDKQISLLLKKRK
jgi:hypothetical protein